MKSTSQPVPQTPQEAATPSGPFIIHVDAADYTTDNNNNNNSAPQRIPADTVAKKTEDANTVENVDEGAWETDLCGCCNACGSAFYTWCLPCMVANDVFMRIGRSGALNALVMFVLYAATAGLSIVFQQGGKTEVFTQFEQRGSRFVGVTYYISHDRQAGLMLGALVCALAYCAVVANVRNAVRRFYNIPGSWARDLALGLFCTCCALAQANIHTELTEKKKKAELAATLPAYTEA